MIIWGLVLSLLIMPVSGIECVYAAGNNNAINDVKSEYAIERENLDSPDTYSELYIASLEIDEDIINYAKQEFANISETANVDVLGLNSSSTKTYKLGRGFMINNLDTEQVKIVYFPVLDGNEVISILTVIKSDANEYSLSYGKSELSVALNLIRGKTDIFNPFYIYSNTEGLVAITQDGSNPYVLETINDDNSNEQAKSIEKLKEAGRNIRKAKKNSNNRSSKFITQEVSDDTVYDIKLNDAEAKTTTNIESALAVTVLTVPTTKVLSVTMEHQSGPYCYAYTGSAVLRYLNGQGTTPSVNYMIDTRKNYTGSDGTNGYIKFIMDVYNMNGVTTGVMTFSQIQNQIVANKPIYTEWWSGDVGHSLAIVGYTTNSSEEYMIIQDPNFERNTYLVSYSSKKYTANKVAYGNLIFTYEDSCYSNK